MQRQERPGEAASVFSAPKGLPGPNVRIQPPPLYAGEEAVLHTNPDRGFRLQLDIDLHRIAAIGDFDAMKRTAAKWVEDQMRGHEEPVTLAQLYLYLHGYNDRDIPDEGLRAAEACLEMLADKNMKAVLRFAYQKENYPPIDSLTDAPQAVLLRHLEQLAPVLERQKRNIHTLEAGFMGAWGEWHSEYYPKDHALVMRKIAEVLLPDGIYLQARQPKYKNLLPADHPAYPRVGIHIDSFFGKIEATDLGTNGVDPGKPQWTQMVKEAPYTPQGGELYWSQWNFDYDIWPDWEKALQQFSEHRFTSFSILHGYWDMRDTGKEDDTVMGRWKRLPVSRDRIEAHGIIANPHFFKTSDGREVPRSVFEFVWSHLGYLLEIQEYSVSGAPEPGGTLRADLELVNYGFSAAFNLRSGFALLDDNGRVVSETAAGDPAKWYGRSPENYDDARLLRHRVAAEIRIPEAGGKYKAAFFLKNDQGRFARVSNRIETSCGYHVLCEFEI